MDSRRIRIASVVLTAAAALLAACGDDEGSATPVAPETAVIESNLEKPTGKVSQGNMAGVFNASRKNATAQSSAGPAMQMMPGAGYATQAGGLSAADYASAGNIQQCVQAGQSGGSIDYGCLTNGKMTGVVAYTASGNTPDNMATTMTFLDVCMEGGSTCMNGAATMRINMTSTQPQLGKMVFSASFDMTVAGESFHFELGYRILFDEAGQTMEYLVFDAEGNSYVVSAYVSDDSASGKVSVRGANGSYTCTYENAGDSGSCTGDGGETFDWTGGSSDAGSDAPRG